MPLATRHWEWFWLGGLIIAWVGTRFQNQWVEYGGLAFMLAVEAIRLTASREISRWDRFGPLSAAAFFTLIAACHDVICR